MKQDYILKIVTVVTALVVALCHTLPVQAFADVWSDHEIQFFDPAACNPSGDGGASSGSTAPPANPSARAANDTLPSGNSTQSLTDDQKISATFNIGFSAATSKSTIVNVVTKYKPAGIFILGTSDAKNDGFTKSFFGSLEQAAGHKLVIASDEEGVIKRYKYAFDFPKAIDMGQKDDGEVKELGKKVGQALSENGVNTNLAPVLDVATSQTGTVAGTAGRAFSSSPETVAKKAGAFAEGLNSGGVKPIYKHFPGLGSTSGNSDMGSVTSPSLAELKLKDLKPYQTLLGKHGGGVMLDNAHVEGLTGPGEVVSISKKSVELLRNNYHYTGLITTDDLKAAGVPVSLPQAISKSLQAGVDMPLFAYTGESDIDSAISAAKSANVDTKEALGKINSFIAGTEADPAAAGGAPASCCISGGPGSAFSGTVSPRVGFGASAKGQENLQKAVTQAGSKFDVDPNFIAAFYYSENNRSDDSTNNANSAAAPPVTGDGKWRDPAPPYGEGGAWPPMNQYTAYGPFQFITDTWRAYKPPGTNDTTDRLDLYTAALAAGKYLAALGAKGTTDEAKLREAAFDYNHSNTYVQSVINVYKYLSTGQGITVSGDGATDGCAAGAATGVVPTGDSKELAQKLLELKEDHKFFCDDASVCADLEHTKDGTPIGGLCGVETLKPQILKLFIYIVNNGFTVGVGSLCSNHHNDGPNGHYGGKAADISSINGKSIGDGSGQGGKADALKLAKFIDKLDGELAPRQQITDGVGGVHDSAFTQLSFNVQNGQKLREPTSGYSEDLPAHRNHIHVGY